MSDDKTATGNPAKGSGYKTAFELNRYFGDLLGGFAAMLVALPSAIAFGILIYSPLGTSHAAQGAVTGILGAIAIGLVAPIFGGAPRLISAPSAPAAAVLVTLVSVLTRSGGNNFSADLIPAVIGLVALLAGALQFVFGSLGGGRLIKYIPYPVVAGYLSGVGILIVIGQLPKLVGLGKGVGLWEGITSPALWQLPALVVGGVSIAIMLLSPKITRAIPAPIVAMIGAVAAYLGLATVYPELSVLTGNPLVVGPIASASGIGSLTKLTERWAALGNLHWASLGPILMPTLTLSVLLSIDTLKTCVVMDALTRSRHNSNRELIGQGLGNIASAIMGGVPGSGTMGATVLNLNSGGLTRISGISVGIFTLAAFLLFDKLVAWIPVAALAGILIVSGLRMVDRHSVRLLRHDSTYFDFLVVAAVVFTAVMSDLMTAAGVGVGLAILLYVRDQIRGSVIRRRAFGHQVFSKRRRLPAEIAALEAKGDQTGIFELQGPLFFGTTDQLFSELEPHLHNLKYLILDMRRIQSVDFTATHMLEQIEAQLGEHGGCLIFSDLPANLPAGQDLHLYFDQVGLLGGMRNVKIFPELDDALEWIEDRILETEFPNAGGEEAPLELSEIHLLSALSPEDLAALAPYIVERRFDAGQKVFVKGDVDDELFLIRRGMVRIELPLNGGKTHHLATFSKGDFFGDMAFLDHHSRSADAIATTAVDVFLLSRAQFDKVAADQPRLGMIFAHLARILAIRLRQADKELASLSDS
jgi:SulP family sulfate permease